MTVYQLNIAAHPMLSELAAALGKVGRQGPPHAERGDWRADIERGTPIDDRPKPWAFRRDMLPHVLLDGLTLPEGARIAALNYYPSGGAGLGWHTDTRNIGWRVYIARPLTETPGALLLPDGSALTDRPGIALAFKVTGRACDSWHAVRAEGPRLSVGLVVANAAREGLGLAP